MLTYYILENTSLESEVMYGNCGFTPRGVPDRCRGGFHGRGGFQGGFPGGGGPFRGGPPRGNFQPRPRNNFQSQSGSSSGPSNQPEVIQVKEEIKQEPQDQQQQQQVDVKCRPCTSHFNNDEVNFRSAHVSEC